MSVAISWAKKVQLARCDISVGFPKSSHIYLFKDPILDGAGCTRNTCCDHATQPWFYRQLNQTTQDDIETRICALGSFRSRSTVMDQLESYIQ